MVREPPEVRSWIICDGDIDPEWVESLNSVLDDNRLLTMPSGERIQFGPNVNFVFECEDLSVASPATVSRVGMIFLSAEDLDVKLLCESWLEQRPESKRQALRDNISDFFYRGLDWVLPTVDTADMVVKQSKLGVAVNGLSQVRDATSKADFACGLVRGLGGGLNLAKRANFAPSPHYGGFKCLQEGSSR